MTTAAPSIHGFKPDLAATLASHVFALLQGAIPEARPDDLRHQQLLEVLLRGYGFVDCGNGFVVLAPPTDTDDQRIFFARRIIRMGLKVGQLNQLLRRPPMSNGDEISINDATIVYLQHDGLDGLQTLHVFEMRGSWNGAGSLKSDLGTTALIAVFRANAET